MHTAATVLSILLALLMVATGIPAMINSRAARKNAAHLAINTPLSRLVGGLGEEMQLPGAAAWTVLDCAGHTDDSIGRWTSDSKALLCGDAAFTTKGRARFASATFDDDLAERTIARSRPSGLPQ